MYMVCIQKRENHKPSSPTHLTLAILLLQPLSAGMTGAHHPSRLYFFAPLFTGRRTNTYFWWTFSKTQQGRSHAFGLGKALTILRGHILYLKKNLFYPPPDTLRLYCFYANKPTARILSDERHVAWLPCLQQATVSKPSEAELTHWVAAKDRCMSEPKGDQKNH